MSAPFVGEIRLFAGTFAPVNWALCNGALLPISEYETLFTLIGTTYGGNGQTNFGLPNLASRVPVHQGTSNGTPYVIGQLGGVESVTLLEANMPAHNHLLYTGTGAAQSSPLNGFPGTLIPQQSVSSPFVYGTPPSPPKPTTLAPKSIQTAGSSLPHDNIQPYLAVTYIISLFGIFPSQG